MKKIMLFGVLLTLITVQVSAEPTSQEKPSSNSNNPITPIAPDTSKPNGSDNKAVTNQPSQLPPSPPASPVIDCSYKIAADTKTIDKTIVLTWSKKATTQAFEFNPATIDAQLELLKSCFTDEGWKGFNSALQKSGNIDAIKTQKLIVNSLVDGQPQITEEKNNQWKITLPIQVIYQNEKEKVTQLLNVNITVGRKLTGDLGIMQMIAAPRPALSGQQDINSTANPTKIESSDSQKTSGSTDSKSTAP